MLDGKVFYQTVAKYYADRDFEGARKYLEAQEKEMKYMVMPTYECMN